MSQPHSDENDWPLLETIQSTLIGWVGFQAAIAPLGLPPLVVTLFVITLVQNWENCSAATAVHGLRRSPPALATLAFVTFAALSSAWAARPGYAFVSIAQCVLTGFSAWFVASTLADRMELIGAVRRNRFTRALPITAIFIALYFILDAVTGDGATLFFVHNFPWIFDGFHNSMVFANNVPVGLDPTYFNRTAAALTMLVFGVVAALRFWPHRRLRTILGVAVTAGMILVNSRSSSSTAMLAIAVGIGVFALAALWSSRHVMRAMQFGFAVLTMAAIPLALAPKMLNLDKNEALPLSFQDRVIIWDELGRTALKHPWLGTGAKTVKFTKHWRQPIDPKSSQVAAPRSYSHPHNGYLQVWLEMGVVGAILFALAGTLLIGAIAGLPATMQPYTLALAGATMAVIGPGWGLWQPWLIAVIGFGWIALLILRSEFKDEPASAPG